MNNIKALQVGWVVRVDDGDISPRVGDFYKTLHQAEKSLKEYSKLYAHIELIKVALVEVYDD